MRIEGSDGLWGRERQGFYGRRFRMPENARFAGNEAQIVGSRQ